MNVVIIGSGGREHALAYKISQSEYIEQLYIIPGNPGTDQLGQNVNLKLNDHSTIVNFCKEKEIDLVVIGPEQPLVDGMANVLRENGINVFGPNSEASEIEGKKSFAKNIMKKANVPTAGYIEFTSSMYEHAKEFIKNKKYPCVIKADGLAAGKGVLICNNAGEAENALKKIFVDKAFDSAGDKILIEEFLEGKEASVFVITDGSEFICLPPAQDHKRVGDNDTGKNTGGMGAYAPATVVSGEIMEEIKNRIIQPTLQTLKSEGKLFNGCLYVGLMLTDNGPKVVEFNCRFGDPETQAVLPLVKGDFLHLLYSAATGKLEKDMVSYSNGASVCVVAASKGYPDDYQKGFEINGLDNLPDDVVVFQAGTREENGKIISNGGRVLGVTSIIPETNLKLAKEKAYSALDNINFENMYYRNDIAGKALS